MNFCLNRPTKKTSCKKTLKSVGQKKHPLRKWAIRWGLGWPRIGCFLTPLVSIQNPGSSIQEEVGPRVVQTFQTRGGNAVRKKTESSLFVDSQHFPPCLGLFFFQSWNVWTSLGPTSTCMLEKGSGYSHGLVWFGILRLNSRHVCSRQNLPKYQTQGYLGSGI